MAITRYAGDRLVGLSSDSKPTTIPDGATFFETDTLNEFLKVSGSWSQLVGAGTLGYAFPLPMYGSLVNPGDGTTIYVQGRSYVGADYARKVVPKAGTLTGAVLRWYATSTAGSGEDISAYVMVNGNATLIQTVGNTNAAKTFSNSGLSIAVSVGDSINIRVNCPTWATNPSGVNFFGAVYIE
jgi:hypothetical protein